MHSCSPHAPGATRGSPQAQRAAVTPVHPTLPALISCSGGKRSRCPRHDPAARRPNAHGGAWRWEDPGISTSSETLRVCVQALSRAPHGSGRDWLSLADPRAGSHPAQAQLGRGLSRERFAGAAPAPDPSRWKQRQACSAPGHGDAGRDQPQVPAAGRETPTSASAPAAPARLLARSGRGCCPQCHL